MDNIMDFTDYETKAMRTCNPLLSHKQLLTNAALGLSGEVGEVADEIKKHLFHEHELNVGAIHKELGDILWYLNLACFVTGTSLQEVAEANINKLQKRYPDKFTSEASKNREEYNVVVQAQNAERFYNMVNSKVKEWQDDMNTGHNV